MKKTVEEFNNDKVVGSTHNFHWRYPHLHSKLPFWINTYGPIQIVGLCNLSVRSACKGRLPPNGWVLISLHGPAQGGGESFKAFLREGQGSYADILRAIGNAQYNAPFAGCYFFMGEYHSPTIWFKDEELGIVSTIPENNFSTNGQIPLFADSKEAEEKINQERRQKGMPDFRFDQKGPFMHNRQTEIHNHFYLDNK